MNKIYLYLALSLGGLSINIQTPRIGQAVEISDRDSARPTLADKNAIAQRRLPTRTRLEGGVISITELTDVQPTDWAYQALRSLIERYGIDFSYLDNSFGGNRSMTRYEFAAALNIALNRINELIGAGAAAQISRNDVTILQRLQEEFVAELTTLRGRVDSLSARTAELEANQFSTTTTMAGFVLIGASAGGFNGDRILDATGAEIARDDPQATTISRATLDFDTSFVGTDLLKIRIEAGTGGAQDNTGAVLEPFFASALDYSLKPPTDGEFVLARLYYSFTPFDNFRLDIGPSIVPTDYIDTNSYANLCFFDFSTLAMINNYILFPVFGANGGAVINWNPGEGPFRLRALYAAPGAADPGEGTIGFGLAAFTELLYPGESGELGLFGDFYQSMVELEFKPSSSFALRLQYSGGELFDRRFDVFGVNLEFTFSEKLGLFGRYGYGSYDDTTFGDVKPNYWMAGFALRDLFVPGALAGFAASQPFIANELGNSTQTNFEVFYNFPINDNIRITPLVQFITNAGNQDDNDSIVSGTIRMVLSF